jgi:2-keto-4-pentenoate hydratase/2-oxohepta-3-ene-1,7-dioic acid hydratase in catechol pathway
VETGYIIIVSNFKGKGMKLVRYGNPGDEKPGVIVSGKRYDCSPYFKDWNRDFFQSGGLQALQEVLNRETLTEIPDTERWASPIARPGIIMCVGLNYSDHAKESGMDIPKEPLLFMKAANTICGPYDEVTIPKGSQKTDWEVELGVVLNRDVLYLKDEMEAEEAIAGYCIVHDLSERDFQLNREGQWVKGKSCPGFSPVGPYLLSREKIGNVHAIQMILSVNGEIRQSGNTSTMVFKPAYLVWYISQFMMLEAGDLISTGTPPGVGLGMKPPRFLQSGDVAELTIDGLGSQKQRFVNYKG